MENPGLDDRKVGSGEVVLETAGLASPTLEPPRTILPLSPRMPAEEPPVLGGETPAPVPKGPEDAVEGESRKEEPPLPPGISAVEGHLSCPTYPGLEVRPLVLHNVNRDQCRRRQREGYHKCHGCQNRSLPAFEGRGLPPLDNSPSHLVQIRLRGSDPGLSGSPRR